MTTASEELARLQAKADDKSVLFAQASISAVKLTNVATANFAEAVRLLEFWNRVIPDDETDAFLARLKTQLEEANK